MADPCPRLPLTFLRLTANSLAFVSSALICIVIVPAFSLLILGCIGLSYFVRGFLRSTMYMQRIGEWTAVRGTFIPLAHRHLLQRPRLPRRSTLPLPRSSKV